MDLIARLSHASLCLFALAFALAVPVSGPAWSQPGDDHVTTGAPGAGEQDGQEDLSGRQDPDIIQKPDAGEDPEDAGDRGGALQVVLFVAMTGGLVLIVTLALRESRRKHA